MNNPFEYTPSEECERAFRALTHRLERLKSSTVPDDIEFCRELEAGKMLGVLIATDSAGVRHTLYAFSGQAGRAEFHHPWFVEPVCDYLRPDGYFKIGEREISLLSDTINEFQTSRLTPLRAEYEEMERQNEREITILRQMYRKSKRERARQRETGSLTLAQEEALIRQSQFEKAELRRLKRRLAERIAPIQTALRSADGELSRLREERRVASERLQHRLFSDCHLLNARGESRSLTEIFADTSFRTPPSGAGECCAPKLLQAAYLKGLQPVEISEFWYGLPKDGELRISGRHYPACRGKCLPILSWMLQGLNIAPPLNNDLADRSPLTPEIIFENKYFCVVNKPSGMLSVPGKGEARSLQEILSERYGTHRSVKPAHRLDRDTSGLIIFTFDDTTYKILQSLFATRRVSKTYMAILDGNYQSAGLAPRGIVTLPIAPDILDRPRQRIDFQNGKAATTEYEFIGSTPRHRSRVIFRPLTGRTHQLRVHAASLQGLGLPIVGDPLYGKNSIRTEGRMMLHALKIEFTLPTDGRTYIFETEPPF